MEMISRTKAVEVLVDVMKRPAALGIIMSRKRIHMELRTWAKRKQVREGGLCVQLCALACFGVVPLADCGTNGSISALKIIISGKRIPRRLP
jgi:hypothetical protein